MHVRSTLSRSEFEQTLTQRRVTSLSIIYAALIVGILTFAVIAFAIPGNSQHSDEGSMDILLLLSGVHAFTALTMYSVVPIILKQLLNIEKIQASAAAAPPAEKVLAAIQSAHIIRMAMYEGAAIFGLIICLLTSLWGHAATNPELLLNGLSAFFFLVMSAATFPTKERLLNIFSEYFERTSL
ncbi:MAG: hypothetical protein HYV29_01485 [Ignavibacteriales bacterium]|nr:hypothetical protein [Ignavibacteriales bacterium]